MKYRFAYLNSHAPDLGMHCRSVSSLCVYPLQNSNAKTAQVCSFAMLAPFYVPLIEQRAPAFKIQ